MAGLGKACELAEQEYETNITRYKKNKDVILNLIKESGIKYKINGNQEFCMPNTLNVSFVGVESEALMLSSKQYCAISNGSACTSNSYSPSYVLKAMGLDEERISSAVRISWGANMNTNELIKQMAGLINVAQTLAI